MHDGYDLSLARPTQTRNESRDMPVKRDPIARRFRDYRPERVGPRRDAREAHLAWLRAERTRIGERASLVRQALRPFWAETNRTKLEQAAKFNPIVAHDEVLASLIVAAAGAVRHWPGEYFVRRVVKPIMGDPRPHLPPEFPDLSLPRIGFDRFDYSHMSRCGDGVEAGGRLFALAFDGAEEASLLKELKEWSAVLGDWPARVHIHAQDTRVGIYFFFMTLEEWIEGEAWSHFLRIDKEIQRLMNREIDIDTPAFWQSPGHLLRTIERLRSSHDPSDAISMAEIERLFLIPVHRLVKWATADAVSVRVVKRKQWILLGSLISKLEAMLEPSSDSRLPNEPE